MSPGVYPWVPETILEAPKSRAKVLPLNKHSTAQQGRESHLEMNSFWDPQSGTTYWLIDLKFDSFCVK